MAIRKEEEKKVGMKITDNMDGEKKANEKLNMQTAQIPKGLTVTDAINNIIAGSTGVLPANFSLKIENIQSQEQFALSLGLDVNSTFVDVAGKLNYDSDARN